MGLMNDIIIFLLTIILKSLFINQSSKWFRNSFFLGYCRALLSEIPKIATVAGIVAALLIAQWYVWNITSYDHGNGFGINLIGVFP